MPDISTLEWDGVVYHAMTDWQRSSSADPQASTLYPAVRFLMGEDSTVTSAHVIAQYGAYCSGNSVPQNNDFLIRRLNSQPNSDINQDPNYPAWTGSNAIDKFWQYLDRNQRTGYIYTASITEHIIWYNQPYFITDFSPVSPGGSVTSKPFYACMSNSFSTAPACQATSYTVGSVSITYDANGGTGTTTGSTRILAWNGSNYKLTVAQNGFKEPAACAFVGWSTTQHSTPYATEEAARAVVDYYPDSEYSGNSNLVLYPVWRSTKKTIEYNSNIPTGASGSVSNMPIRQEANANVDITLRPNIPNGSALNPPYEFDSWNTSATGAGGSKYNPSGTYTSQYSATLYAQWTTDYVRPVFSGITVQRSDSNGRYKVDGEYLHVKGKVKVNATQYIAENEPETLVISYTTFAGVTSNITVTSFNENGNYWDFEYISDSNILDPGTTYTVKLTFKDTFQTTYAHNTGISSPLVSSGYTIGVAFITFSVNAMGKTAAFGRQALAKYNQQTQPIAIPSNGRLDISMDTYFAGKIYFGDDPQNPVVVDFSNSTVTGLSIPTVNTATTSSQGIVQIPKSVADGGDGSITIDGNGVIHSLYCTEKSGGTTWVQCCSFSGNGVGWREEKWSDGRLTRWIWDYWPYATSADRTIAVSGATDFVSMPTCSVGGCYTAGRLGVYIGVTSWTNTTLNFFVSSTPSGGTAGNTAICVKMDGHWQ